MAVPNHQDRVVESNGVSAVAAFGISQTDQAHIMNILRDTLYSDKVLAVIREYSANAWDAHREAGIGDRAISVVMPTTMNPTLSIRDFGKGLSHESVFEVFTKYGASTKRDSNTGTGMLGIGCKSGFAYSDTFSVTSWHGGKKRCYVAVLDETEKGQINLLHEEDCGDETGVLIEIGVQIGDIAEFHSKAANLYQYFEPRPNINIELPPPPDMTGLTQGSLARGRGEWVALMGCIAYRVNLDQIGGLNYSGSGIANYVHRLDGILRFEIGDLHFSASREELKYSQMTKQRLVEKINALTEEFVTTTLANIDSTATDAWTKRMRGKVLVEMGLPLPKDMKKRFEGEVELKPEPRTFTVHHSGAQAGALDVDTQTRMIFVDDNTKVLSGYNLSWYDYLIRPKATAKLSSVEKEFKKLTAKWGITGVPTTKISSLPWHPPPAKNSRGKIINKKHSVRLFRFDPSLANRDSFYAPFSRYWDMITHKPGPQDVFVCVSGFLEVTHGRTFFNWYTQDRAIANLAGAKMPTIYGYKVTAKVPTPKTTGIHYTEWRQQFRDSLMSDEIAEYVALKQWAELLNEYRIYDDDITASMFARLGEEHPICQLIEKKREAKLLLTPLLKDKKLSTLVTYLTNTENNAISKLPNYAEALHERVLNKYPLLSVGNHQDLYINSNQDEWLDYVQLIDRTCQEDE